MSGIGYFEIQADDIEKAKSFYSTVFGWKFARQEGTPVEYWSIETDDDIRGGLLKRPLKTPPPEQGTNAFVCSMWVDDFDETANIIQQNGGIVAMEKFAVPGKCWQGYFIDNNGNTFGIFQADESAA